jgi:hypothetical protein
VSRGTWYSWDSPVGVGIALISLGFALVSTGAALVLVRRALLGGEGDLLPDCNETTRADHVSTQLITFRRN